MVNYHNPFYFLCFRNAVEPERGRAKDMARLIVNQLSTSKIYDGSEALPPNAEGS